MPIITFIRDLLAALGGSYHRTVGRHTRRFCRRAASLAVNGPQRKMLLVAAVAADDYIGALLGISDKPCPAAAASARGRWAANRVPDALRAYLSVLLLLLGSRKDEVLKHAALDERRFLDLWCAAFEYRPADIERFDGRLRAAYRQSGVDGLAAAAAADIYALLYPDTAGADDREKSAMETAVRRDVSAVLRSMAKAQVNEACS